MEESRVLIISVTFNKKEYISNLLKSLQNIQYSNFDVVVVDNASSDGTVAFIKENFTGVTVIANQENTGGSGGFNTGLAYAFQQEGYDYYWLLDNDVEVSPDALSALVAAMEKSGDIAVAGSQMCQLDNPEVTNEIGANIDLYNGCLVLNRHLTRKRNNSSGFFEVDYIAAASMLVRADAAKKAGLWEDFFIHFDDVEWCLRIKKMGYRVIGVADSVIWHLSAAEKPITWQYYYDTRNMLYLLRKYSSEAAVARFARRKCLQAVYISLRGLPPVSEIILDALDDFSSGKKGKKAFFLPPNINDEDLKASHPQKNVFICQNEWFDLGKFPFEDGYYETIKEIMLPVYLIDAFRHWKRNGNISVFTPSKIKMLLLLIAGLLGYRRYSRAYVDIRTIPYLAHFLSEELVVKINGINWLIDNRGKNLRKKLFGVIFRSLKNYFKFSAGLRG